MNVDLLTAFVHVVEHRSISGAAHHLGYSQSAVSVKMQQLQRLVGVPLLERRGQSVPTAAGIAFSADCVAVLLALDGAIERARAASTATHLRRRPGLLSGVHHRECQVRRGVGEPPGHGDVVGGSGAMPSLSR